MSISRVLAVGLGSSALILGSSAAAVAGEVTGNGNANQAPAHTNSICAYSGLNDDPNEEGAGGRVQSYGQIVRSGGKAFAPSPSLLCNGHSGLLAGGGVDH